MNRIDIDQILRRERNRELGFTLIELMIVVAVIAILTLIAYPSYIDSVRKGKRGQAKADLLTDSQQMERCFTQTNSYNNCWNGNTSNVLPAPYNISATNGTTNYNIALVVAGGGTGFTLAAAPQGDQVNDPCGALSIDQAGNKLPVIVGQTCW